MTCKYNYAGSGKEIMPTNELRDRGERIWQTINTSDKYMRIFPVPTY
jgi:hypothetical protein